MEESTVKPKRQKAKIYATLLNHESRFDIVLVAENEKDLNEQLLVYASSHEDFSISSIIKGQQIDFVETKKISFLR